MRCTLLFLSLLLASCTSTGGSPRNAPEPLAPGTSCSGGLARQGYLVHTTSGDVPCPTGTQFCIAGKWAGPKLFERCENHTKSCGGHPHGTVISGYLQPTSPRGVPCTPAVKSCADGEWSGPEVFTSCEELP